MLINIITLIAAAFFVGAAGYINLIEHPARIKLDSKSMLQEWKFGIKRATIILGSWAIITFLLACASYVITHNLIWIMGGIVMIMNWPFTLLVIMPINKMLISINSDNASEQTKSLIKRWNKLHTVRTFLGIVATLIFAFGLSLSQHQV